MTVEPASASAPASFVDLHMHSTASDGILTPSQVVASAVSIGLRAIALTDHDTVAGFAEARDAARGTPLRVLAGVELSASQGEDEVHLLGLHLEHLEVMHRELGVFRDARRERAVQMVARLNAIGVSIKFDDVLSAAKGGTGALGRPHVAKALIDNGWARDHRDAFDRYLGQGKPAFLEKRRLSLREAIAMVHRTGGIAVLAHPGSAASQTRLKELQQQGLDGVEVLHPGHSQDDRRRLLESARALGLVVSGGSDSHGAPEGSRAIGSMQVPLSWLDEQLECVAKRRRAVSAA